jgi:hypothetical protein
MYQRGKACGGWVGGIQCTRPLTIDVFVHRRVFELLLVLGESKHFPNVFGREPVFDVLVQLLLEEGSTLGAASLVSFFIQGRDKQSGNLRRRFPQLTDRIDNLTFTENLSAPRMYVQRRPKASVPRLRGSLCRR